MIRFSRDIFCTFLIYVARVLFYMSHDHVVIRAGSPPEK